MFPAVMILIFVCAASQKAEPAQPPSDKIALLILEQDWNKAHIEGDIAALDRLWAEELIVTVPRMQSMGKKELLELWRSGVMKFTKYQTFGTKVQIYGDAAVMTGNLSRARVRDGKDIEEEWVYTKVLVRREGVWRVVAWHASDAPKK